MSEITKKKISLAHLGMQHSKEVRRKISNSCLTAWTPERLQAKSNWLRELIKSGQFLGHKEHSHSLETRKQFSENRLLKWAKLSPTQRRTKVASWCVANLRSNAKTNKIELAVKSCLETLGVKYAAQKLFLSSRLCVVDFYLPAHNVALECDGYNHETFLAKENDKKRDKFMFKRYGVRTIRIKAVDVIKDAMEATRVALQKAGIEVTVERKD